MEGFRALVGKGVPTRWVSRRGFTVCWLPGESLGLIHIIEFGDGDMMERVDVEVECTCRRCGLGYISTYEVRE